MSGSTYFADRMVVEQHHLADGMSAQKIPVVGGILACGKLFLRFVVLLPQFDPHIQWARLQATAQLMLSLSG